MEFIVCGMALHANCILKEYLIYDSNLLHDDVTYIFMFDSIKFCILKIIITDSLVSCAV